MRTVLVTGASSFLGYHVVKRLNEQGIRPRVLELAESKREPLGTLDVSQCEGHLEDPRSLSAACDGADTLLHLAFRVSVGGGAALLEEMRRINVGGTERLARCRSLEGRRDHDRRSQRARRRRQPAARASRRNRELGRARIRAPLRDDAKGGGAEITRQGQARIFRGQPSAPPLRWDPTIPSVRLPTS